MGDVLSGVIGSYLTQGLEPAAAARLGVFLHGLAGDLAAVESGGTVVLASEVSGNIRRAVARLVADKPSTGGGRK
jgi:NAD(P)H-hydrate epimerase